MAAMQRATSKSGKFHTFGSRLPAEVYDDLSEWAWENRMTLSAAVGILTEKALMAERKGNYKRYADNEAKLVT